MQRALVLLSLLFSLLFLTSCETKMVIINQVDEREANEIVVFLASKGIASEKTATVSSAPGASSAAPKYSISVNSEQATDAMAILNQNGLPRIKGTSLLEIFGGTGLMTSDKEETIRYQAGLAEQLATMIRKIDGVIDADVQLSFPAEATATYGPWSGSRCNTQDHRRRLRETPGDPRRPQQPPGHQDQTPRRRQRHGPRPQ